MNPRSYRRLALLAALVCLLTHAAAVPGWGAEGVFSEEVARLQAGDPQDNGAFGDAVDIDGDTVVVGSYWQGAVQRGAVYISTRSASGWSPVTKVASPSPVDWEWFGASVGVSGEWMVVGAPGRNGQRGRIYLYRSVGGTWQHYATIDPPGIPDINYRFGAAVAIDGTTIVVGMPGLDDVMGDSHGIAHIYAFNGSNWFYQGNIYDNTPVPNAELGTSVAIDGDIAVAGSPGENSSRGTVMVATRSGGVWTSGPKLSAPDASNGDSLGSTVGISGNTILACAYIKDVSPYTDAGGAYIFTNSGSGWALQAALHSPAPGTYEEFGFGGAIDGDTLVIGEMEHSSTVPIPGGTAHVYRRTGDTWNLVQQITKASENNNYRMFGCAAAGSNGSFVVGAYAEDIGTAQAGAAYVFSRLEPVYRFYNPGAGTHFYTPSADERNHVIATWPSIFAYEGVAYQVNPENNTQPLFRFYNNVSRSHFYTASPAEASNVMTTLSHIYSYDGPTYAVTPAPSAGIPVYRFYKPSTGSHFYTASASERDHVMATWPTIYTFEGTAFWLGQ